MPVVYSVAEERDIGGRRSGVDRRSLFIPGYTPERRSHQDRRSSQERRGAIDLENAITLERNIDRYTEFVNTQKGIFLALLLSFPIWALIIFIIIK